MTNFTFPFPALVCDTGGTNVRFALVSEPGGRLSDIVHLHTGDYPGLAEAIEAAAPKLGTRPGSMIACGAGPVNGRTPNLTKAPWAMDGRGAAGRFTPVFSDACHIAFGPIRPEKFEIWPHLERAHGRITSESVISGAGLARVHRARMMAKGAPDPRVDPPTVTTAAATDPKGEEATSLRLYWHIVARFAGDMAVTFVATGGLTLSGGVLPRVVDFLDEGAFREAFEAKAPVDGLAKRIPTRLVTREDAVLVGMAAIASKPDRYGIDYGSRAWV